jgi:pyruvate ferredoxin oxidoreductase alpha subunit
VRKLITGNAAAAWGARLAGVDYVPSFPITPQTEIIETLGAWIEAGELAARQVTLDSEHSMVTAAGSAAVTGVRTFAATSSQGLLYAMEMLYTIAGWRAPLVLVNVSRGLSAPITLEPDHNDILAARDSGCLQIHTATCQEVVDSVLMAYRLSEDPRVRLPVIVNLDGFYLSFTREPVSLPDAELCRDFVGEFDAQNLQFRANSPHSQGVAVLGGSPYSYFRYEHHLAALEALNVHEEVAGEFAARFGRSYGALATYRCADAEIVFVMLGSFATKAQAAVDRLREEGMAVGLVRPRLLRPFPEQALRQALEGKRAAVVIDQNLSIGRGGVLHTELAATLCGHANMPQLSSFIGGLGGRDITASEFAEMARTSVAAARDGRRLPPRLLYTDDELRDVRKLQVIAHVERSEQDLVRQPSPPADRVEEEGERA